MDSCRDGEVDCACATCGTCVNDHGGYKHDRATRGQLLDEYRKTSRWSYGSKLEAKGFQRWLKERESDG